MEWTNTLLEVHLLWQTLNTIPALWPSSPLQFPLKTNAYVSTIKVHHHTTPGSSSVYMVVNVSGYMVAESMNTVIRARNLEKRTVYP